MNCVMSFPEAAVNDAVADILRSNLKFTWICAFIDVVYEPGKRPWVQSFNHRVSRKDQFYQKIIR